jgi:hypothetical protein
MYKNYNSLLIAILFLLSAFAHADETQEIVKGKLYIVEMHTLVAEVLHSNEQSSVLTVQEIGNGSIREKNESNEKGSDLLKISKLDISNLVNLEKSAYLKILAKKQISFKWVNDIAKAEVVLQDESDLTKFKVHLTGFKSTSGYKVNFSSILGNDNDEATGLEVWHGVKWNSSWDFSDKFGMTKLLIFEVDEWGDADISKWWSTLKYGTLIEIKESKE